MFTVLLTFRHSIGWRALTSICFTLGVEGLNLEFKTVLAGLVLPCLHNGESVSGTLPIERPISA